MAVDIQHLNVLNDNEFTLKNSQKDKFYVYFTIKKLKADRKIKCKYLNAFSLMRRLQVVNNLPAMQET